MVRIIETTKDSFFLYKESSMRNLRYWCQFKPSDVLFIRLRSSRSRRPTSDEWRLIEMIYLFLLVDFEEETVTSGGWHSAMSGRIWR